MKWWLSFLVMFVFLNVTQANELVFCQGGQTSLKLDVFTPLWFGPHPGLILVHGGGWWAGDKGDFKTYAKNQASRGYVTATIEYRLSDKAPFPAALQDVKCAIRWMRANSAKYNIDPERIGLLGGSAGAHLALLAAYAGAEPDLEGDGGFAGISSQVRAVVSWAGPTDLKQIPLTNQPLWKAILQFMGATPAERPDLYEKVNPLHFITSHAPATLAIHGDRDDLVQVTQAYLLREKLVENNLPHQVIILNGADHGFLADKKFSKQTFEATDQFLDQQLK